MEEKTKFIITKGEVGSGGGKKNYKFGIIYTLLYIKQDLLYSTGNNI